MLRLGQLKKEPLSGQTKCIVIDLTILEQRVIVALLIMGRDPVELAKRAKYQPPAMRVRGVCYTKKSPFRYNKVVQANL